MERNKELKQQVDIKIYVIGHKIFQVPVKNSMYIPLMVGKHCDDKLPKEYRKDNVGKNISHKNLRYNELTGLFWIWKNSDSDIVGICHYRRYFVTPIGKLKNLVLEKKSGYITEKYVEKQLKNYDIILHNKTFLMEGNRNQVCNNKVANQNNFNNKLDKEIMQIADEIFEKIYPEDVEIYRKIMTRKYAHLLNIMICKKEVFNRYCQWLFKYLFEVEEEIETKLPKKEYTRCMGLLGERMLDVWVEKEKLRVKECFTINMERKDWKMW